MAVTLSQKYSQTKTLKRCEGESSNIHSLSSILTNIDEDNFERVFGLLEINQLTSKKIDS